MQRVNQILMLTITVFICFFNFSFAQKQNSNQQFSPEKILQFLDNNNDQKISKQEASTAKRLANNFKYLDTNNDGFLTLDELKNSNSSNRYTYLESDGLFMYYETEGTELYRKLLPEKFDMPDRLLVYTFISDFYKMDDQTQPYKEASIFLLGKYKGKEIWHCVYMPVTSEESMRMGVIRLGLPKTMGEIEFSRSETMYDAKLLDKNKNTFSLSLDTKEYTLNQTEEKMLKELSLIPKMNLLDGKVIEMSKNGNGNKNRSIFDLAKIFPHRITIKNGKGKIDSHKNNKDLLSPLDLKPIRIIGAYYMHNTIPFKLRKKQ